MIDNDRLKVLAEHLGAAAAHYTRRTGTIGGEGLIEHLQEAAILYLRERQAVEAAKNNIEQEMA